MLVALFRIGSCRQRIRKGYGVHGLSLSQRPALERALGDLPAFAGAQPRGTLTAESQDRASITIDSGWLDFGDPTVRRQWLIGMSEASGHLSDVGRRLGAVITPGGIRGRDEAAPCRDEHLLETESDVEREVLTNLLRASIPTLIAVSAQPGWMPGVRPGTGSFRLTRATDHVPTAYVASLAPSYLPHLRAHLRRTDGVAGLDVMDVDPTAQADGVSGVSVRAIDSQVLLTSTLAHALLLEAIATNARRLVRDGRRVPAGDGRMLDRNRARAIARGMGAVLEVPHDDRPGTQSAAEAVATLIEEHRRDFLSLRTQPQELSPIALGPALAASGRVSVRTEADLQLRWNSDSTFGTSLGHVAGALMDSHRQSTDLISEANRALAGAAADDVLAGLTSMLAPHYFTGPSRDSQPSGEPRDNRNRDTRAAAPRRSNPRPPAEIGSPHDSLAASLAQISAEPGNLQVVLTGIGRYLAHGGRRLFPDLSDSVQSQVRSTVRQGLALVEIHGDDDWNRAKQELNTNAAVIARLPVQLVPSPREALQRTGKRLDAETVSLGAGKGSPGSMDVLAIPRAGHRGGPR